MVLTSNERVPLCRVQELERAYADCGCGLGAHAACVDTHRALRELIALRKSLSDARDLLSGEFYAEALGEIDDALGGAA